MRWPDSQCSALWARSRRTICRPRRPGAQQRGFRVGVDVAGGQFRGDGLAGRDGGGRRGAGAGDVLLQARDAGVLGGGGKARVGEQGGEATLGGSEGLLRVADGGVRLVAGGVADQLGVRLDAGQVVADLVYAVVLAGVLEDPPPRTSARTGCPPGRRRSPRSGSAGRPCRARTG